MAPGDVLFVLAAYSVLLAVLTAGGSPPTAGAFLVVAGLLTLLGVVAHAPPPSSA